MAAIGIGTYSISRQKLISISSRAGCGKMETPLAERVWDKIADFFCGTHREEAKQCLAILYSPRESGQQRFDAFSRLRNLAGEACLDKFSEHRNGVFRKYTFLPDDPSLGCTLYQTNWLSDCGSTIGETVLEELGELRESLQPGGFGNIPHDDFDGMADRVDTTSIPRTSWSSFNTLAQDNFNAEETTALYFLCDPHVYATVRKTIETCGSRDYDMCDFQTYHREVHVVRNDEDGRIHYQLRGVEYDSGSGDRSAHEGHAEGFERPSERLDVLFWVTIDHRGNISNPHVEAWTRTSERDLALMQDVFDRM